MLARSAFLLAALVLPGPAASAQLAPADLFVDVDATGPVHDGSSWCSAYLTLDDALAVVSSGQTIRVAGGLYTPDPTGLADPRAASFELVDGTTIVGAYAGCGAPDPWARDYANDTTILRGDPLQNDQSGGTQADNSYHVLVADGLSSSTVIDGLYVDAANADSPGVTDGNVGGGLLARKSSGLRVVECIFQDCKATTGPDAIVGRGGAVYLRKSKVVFEDTLFRESIAGESGGGVYMESSSAVFDVCTFAGDVSGITGGGLTIDAKSRAALLDNDFFACSSSSFPLAGAGGDVAVLGGQALLVDCSMSGDAGLDGGSIAAKGGTVDAVNCTFVFDSAGRYGGAVYASGTAMRLVNGRFTGCSADRGGAIWSRASKLTVSNCTIADNSANAGAAGIELVGVGGGASVGNTILWGNDVGGATGEPQQVTVAATTTLLLNHCDVEGLTGALGGVGNIGVDPLFVNPTGFDWRLSAGSPCVDAGSGTLVANDFGDLDGDGIFAEPTPLDLDLAPRVAGAAVYSPRVLRIYDWLVPRSFIPFVWGLPLGELRALYRRKLSANHLEVGVGTGFFLDEAEFPAAAPRLVLVDLSPNSLAHAGRRLARYEPELVRASALDPLPLGEARFDSVAMNALLHCLPGPLERKAAAFDHAAARMNPGAALFGCTLMDEGTGPVRSWIQERFRRRGIFGNRGDGPEGLERELRARFEEVRVEVRGAMAVFEARKG